VGSSSQRPWCSTDTGAGSGSAHTAVRVARTACRNNAKPRMHLAGLRDDDEAVEVGIAIIRELVMRGTGPQTPDHLRRLVDQRNLLATSAQLTLAVHAIDRPNNPRIANVTLDWVRPVHRRGPVAPPPRRRPRRLDQPLHGRPGPGPHLPGGYRARRVFITGAMRLATHFAVGNELTDVRRWVLAVEQRGQTWTTDTTPEPGIAVTVLAQRPNGAGGDLAVGIALANDVTDDVVAHVHTQELPMGTALVLGPGAGFNVLWQTGRLLSLLGAGCSPMPSASRRCTSSVASSCWPPRPSAPSEQGRPGRSSGSRPRLAARG
jgi:hypothetical protein